jgi:hypothetical protein
VEKDILANRHINQPFNNGVPNKWANGHKSSKYSELPFGKEKKQTFSKDVESSNNSWAIIFHTCVEKHYLGEFPLISYHFCFLTSLLSTNKSLLIVIKSHNINIDHPKTMGIPNSPITQDVGSKATVQEKLGLDFHRGQRPNDRSTTGSYWCLGNGGMG